MSKTKVCVSSFDNPKIAACGGPYNNFYITPYCREVITCKKCRKKKSLRTYQMLMQRGLRNE